MGLRFIIFIAAIWVALLIIRFYLGQSSRKRASQSSKSIETVRCQQCGLVLPKKEALLQKNYFFCSKQHADSHTDD
jgi:hypothetical protein